MSLVKISELSDAPEEGVGKRISFEHPLTFYKYDIALFKTNGKFFAMTDQCRKCGASLGRGVLKGKYAACANEECLWNLKTGICKFDRTMSTPVYKVTEQDDGIYINI